ncbi:MAG: glycosyltransferase [Anaerolineae bacterium]|nr:glycosyltransferase [Anaerolineae bacterium]
MEPKTISELTMSSALHSPYVVTVGTYPPRECGIATFTQDTVMSLRQWPDLVGKCTVCAVNDWPASYRYGPEVQFTIEDAQRPSYRNTARRINASGADLVSIQHEYGIFRGDDGEYLLDFVDALRAPLVTTLHTVLSRPEGHFKEVTKAIINSSDAIVVLAQNARQLLVRTCGAPPSKIHYIPHGIPDVAWSPQILQLRQAEMGLSGRLVVSTFGLIGPGKGIEYALDAVASVVSDHPQLLYLIIGRTHPTIVRKEGEAYRQKLLQRCHELGIEHNVVFVNRYLTLRELILYLQATDIYLMPYLDPEQIVSGTMAYAVGAGKPTIATPFAYAREVLADGRGVVVPFRDSEAIAEALTALAQDEDHRLDMAARAYAYTRSWVWREVGRQYGMLFSSVLERTELAPLAVSRATA